MNRPFKRKEFACKCGCGFSTVDYELMDVLVDVRLHFNERVTINSGCRCEEHNKKEDGEKGSKHLQALAADIVVENVHADIVAAYLESKYPNKYGIGRYNGRTHIDVRENKARWDRR